jgi:hypothetical protein
MRREYWWALITLLIAVVLSIFLLNFYWAGAKVAVVCMDPTERERIREIVIRGVDKGLEDQIQHLFSLWVQDLTDQPRRALVGTNNAINAHVHARANALAWDPPHCPDAGSKQ